MARVIRLFVSGTHHHAISAPCLQVSLFLGKDGVYERNSVPTQDETRQGNTPPQSRQRQARFDARTTMACVFSLLPHQTRTEQSTRDPSPRSLSHLRSAGSGLSSLGLFDGLRLLLRITGSDSLSKKTKNKKHPYECRSVCFLLKRLEGFALVNQLDTAGHHLIAPALLASRARARYLAPR